MANESPPDKTDNTDRMQFAFYGISFSVSGKNASKFYWAAGAIGIIIALGLAIANIVGALKDAKPDTPNSDTNNVAYHIRRRNTFDLSRWPDWKSQTT